MIAFSDYYNDTFSPLDDFGQLFFDEWDFEQWNLFWNLLATCVQIYLRHGYVESPAERIEVRRLRQEMTEEFLSWAEEYFSDECHRNTRLQRRDLYDAFIAYAPEQRKFCTATTFKSVSSNTANTRIINSTRRNTTGLPGCLAISIRTDSR